MAWNGEWTPTELNNVNMGYLKKKHGDELQRVTYTDVESHIADPTLKGIVNSNNPIPNDRNFNSILYAQSGNTAVFQVSGMYGFGKKGGMKTIAEPEELLKIFKAYVEANPDKTHPTQLIIPVVEARPFGAPSHIKTLHIQLTYSGSTISGATATLYNPKTFTGFVGFFKWAALKVLEWFREPVNAQIQRGLGLETVPMESINRRDQDSNDPNSCGPCQHEYTKKLVENQGKAPQEILPGVKGQDWDLNIRNNVVSFRHEYKKVAEQYSPPEQPKVNPSATPAGGLRKRGSSTTTAGGYDLGDDFSGNARDSRNSSPSNDPVSLDDAQKNNQKSPRLGK